MISRRWWCGPEQERGSSTVDALLIVPLFFFASLIVVQLALGWLGENVAQAAARQGLHAATAFEGSNAEGRDQARAYLRAVAPRLLPRAQVEVTRTDTAVSVQVTGPVLAILPWPRSRIDARASGPIERFVGGT